jgi:FixJ family two-component response regulator
VRMPTGEAIAYALEARGIDQLSERERAVAALVADCPSYKEIAGLRISERTAENPCSARPREARSAVRCADRPVGRGARRVRDNARRLRRKSDQHIAARHSPPLMLGL